jgi:hypothetical protein
MTLREVLLLAKVRQVDLVKLCRQLAEQRGLPTIGYSQSRISLICSGKMRPKEHEQRIIEEALNAEGLVSWPEIQKEKQEGDDHGKKI